MHFCAIRVFAESILRHGLPPSFLACVLSPSTKSEKKVRSILEGFCDNSNSTYWKSEDEMGGGIFGLGGDADAHPLLRDVITYISGYRLTLSKRQKINLSENKPITMTTLKLNGFCGCIGCWRKVNDALSGIEGIERKLIDKKKFLVTVTGTVDTESLKAKLAKIRKSGKVEVIFQGDGEKKKEEEKKPKEEANTKQKEENPREKSDTNQNKEMKEEAEQKEKVDKAKVKSEKTSPSTSNDADDSPSIRGGRIVLSPWVNRT
ncbi:V-TYPE PROTON ATPASE SUBUNIT C [Salix purpurea]|uniref:V-type proton ATPase subunit C n=1 Tax=Salix purpurea TaxID=77065 RepID=A0A9Q0VUG6_SALPP|nr:V-TYPE PROTON ATPASE SUBUNIT C [Salix purpurea]